MKKEEAVVSAGTATVRAICVCACTYRRPEGLAAMLEGIARQTFLTMPTPTLHVVIADNECSDNARAICEDFERRAGISVTYVPEPQRGISFARNACLDNIPAGFEFFASIDDVEIPDPDWLERLLEAQAATGADVVQGPVVPVFPEGTPDWLAKGNFFGRPRRGWLGTAPHREDYQELGVAGTGNALVRLASVTSIDLRFDPKLAFTGGEDTAFFKMLKSNGNRIVYAARARVSETIPRERATFWYRVKLEYRIGNAPLPDPDEPMKKRVLKRWRKRWRRDGPAIILSGIKNLLRGGIAREPDMDQVMVAGMQIAYGLGRFARALGFEYYVYR